MEVIMIKTTAGGLVPADEEQAELLKRFKPGDTIRGEYKLMRNAKFHRKGMSLLHLCYGKFCERLDPAEYKGVPAKPSFETWRKQFTILAGHYDVTFDIRGKIKLEAKSLSFANCKEDEFEKIYSSFIDCALKHAYFGSMSEAEIRSLVDQIMAYT